MRMYWLVHFISDPFGEKELPSRNAHDNEPLLMYAIAQRDLAELDKGAIESSSPPRHTTTTRGPSRWRRTRC